VVPISAVTPSQAFGCFNKEVLVPLFASTFRRFWVNAFITTALKTYHIKKQTI
jgi:hypothetical protein